MPRGAQADAGTDGLEFAGPAVRGAAEARALVARFPLPAVILHGDGSADFANAKARDRVANPWLAANGSRLVRFAAQGRPELLDVIDPGGRSWRASVHAAALGDRFVVVCDDQVGARRAEQILVLHRRILELEQASATDRLTGLWNRRHFDQIVAREISFSESQLSPLSLVILGLEQIESLDARHGAAVGDGVVRLAALRLRAVCRPTDFLFHWDRGEFAVLAPAALLAAANAIAERLRRNIAAHPMPGAGAVTVSAGIGEHREGESAVPWHERIEVALHEARRAGRDRIRASNG